MELEFNDILLKVDDDPDHSKLQQCVRNVIKNEGYIKYSIHKRVFTPDGGSFLGIFCEIDIKGQTDDKEEKNTNIFVKIITPGEQMTLISLTDAYKKELFIYGELSQIFQELQDEISLPQEQRFKIVKGYMESTPSFIILENMNRRGFKTLHRMDTITLEYAKLAVKELAKFHALSYVLEARKPEYFERKIRTINQPIVFSEDYKGFIENMCKITLSCLYNDIAKRFEKFMDTCYDKYQSYLFTKCGNNVLCHGDYRPNNILMKETNGVISEVIPIDYQFMYYGCPIMDFCYLIFPSTDREFRKTHLQSLKDLYHSILERFLSYFGLEVDQIYSKRDFEDQLKEKLDYGLIMSVLLVPFLMANETKSPDITKGSMSGLNFGVDDKFRDRMVGIVEDFVEWGYLQTSI